MPAGAVTPRAMCAGRSFFPAFLVVCTAIAVCAPRFVVAHALDYTVVKTVASAEGNALVFVTALPQAFDAPATDEDRVQMQAYYAERLAVRLKGALCPVTIERLVSRTESAGAQVEGHYVCPESIARLEEISVQSTLFENLFRHMDHFMSVAAGGEVKEFVFSTIGSEGNGADITLSAAPPDDAQDQGSGAITTVMRFVRLGIEHILFGFDHILFLLAVILVVRRLKDIFVLVTAFTLAHSVTLILAGLGVITLAAWIVEPLIALSIAYMAGRDFFVLRAGRGTESMRERWMLTACFGLVHGLGFAGALTEVGIPSRYFVPALFAFNGGVELGQMMVLAVVLPLLKYIEIKQWRWRRHALMGTALLLMLISSLWFIARIAY